MQADGRESASMGAFFSAGETEVGSRTLERLFHLFMEHSPAYIYIKDAELRPVFLTRNFEDLLGHPLDELCRLPLNTFFPGDSAERIIAAERRVIRENVLSQAEEEFRGRHYRSIKFPVKQEGQPTFLAGITLDITEQKLAQEALHRSEEKCRRLFNATVEGICINEIVCDELGDAVDFRILDANQSFGTQLGLQSTAYLGRLASEVFGEDSRPFLPKFAAVAGGAPPMTFDFSPSMLGRHFHVRAFSTHPGTFVVFLEDVTEQKRRDEERRRLEAECQHMQQLESLGSLAGGVAHDMNNVLQAIQGMATALKAKCAGQAELSSGLDLILNASQRGGALVRNLTEFSRKGFPEPAWLDLNKIVTQEVDLLRRTTLQRIEVQMDLDDSLPGILGERAAIETALMNLCVNAMDAMPLKGTLSFRTRRTLDGGAEIEVEDTGKGMSAEVLARAMEPFYTTKARGKGTGLGLPSVYGTMKAHGGSVEIQSQVGRGTRVVLRFPPPRRDAEPRPGPKASAAPGAILEAKHLRIHLVDDDELIRESFPEFVELLGHQVVAVDSEGAAALDRIAGGLEVDIVVLDQNMPGLSGLETLKRLKNMRPDLPVLFCTGHLDDEVRRVLDRWSGVQVLMKPYPLRAIRQALAGIQQAS